MLLIPCPYCGRAPGDSSSATAARRTSPGPRGPASVDDAELGRLPLPARQHPRACTPSAGATRTAAGASSTRCATPRRDHFLATYKVGEAAARRGPRRRSDRAAAHRHGRPHRPRARRCASRFDGRSYSGFAGDTLASALLANGVHLVGRSFKYHRPRGILAAGAEEPNALVDVRRDAARDTPNLRATQVELYEGLVARQPESLAEPRASMSARSTTCCRAVAPGGLLLQDLHVAATRAGTRSTSRASARAAGLGRAPHGAGSGSLRATLRPLRRAGRRRGPGGPRRRAAPPAAPARASSCATSRPSSAARCCANRRPSAIDGRAAAAWLAAHVARACAPTRGDAAAAHHGVRLLPAQLRRPQRAAHRSSRRSPRPMRRASGCGRCARARWCSPPARSSGRWCFPATTGPASCSPAPRAPILNRYGVLPGTRAVVVTAADEAYEAALDLQRAGVAIAAIADLRAGRRCAAGTRARRAASRCSPAATVLGTHGRRRVERHRARRASATAELQSARRRMPCDLRADVRRLHAERAPVLAVARQAALGTKRSRPSCRAQRPSARARPAPAAACSRCRSAGGWLRRRRSRRPRGARPGAAGR